MSRGLYRTAGCPELKAWQLVLPASGRFTHLTAAELLGWWVPPRPQSMPVIVAVGRTANRPRRPGLRVVRADPLSAPVLHEGLRVDSPADVVLACARDLSLLDLLVLVDGVLHDATTTRDELAVAAASGRKGTPALRRALDLADARAESPWETVLRLFHLTCDIEVEPQRIVLGPQGEFVARGDLWLVGTDALHEYDGGDHLSRSQQQADLRRARRLVDTGLVRRGYTSHDLLREPVGILRDADRALGRPHDPGRLRAWHELLACSLLTARGKDRLMARLSTRRRDGQA